MESIPGPFLVLNVKETRNTMAVEIWSLLIDSPYYLEVSTFCNKFQLKFERNITMLQLKEFSSVVEVIVTHFINTLKR